MKAIPNTLQPLFDSGSLWKGRIKTTGSFTKTGFTQLNNILASNGWPPHYLIDILTDNKVLLPTNLILPFWKLLSKNKDNWLALINPPRQPCTEGWIQQGINTSKIDIINVNKHLFAWCTEQFCKSVTTTSILAWAPEKISFIQLRRLQLACKKNITQLFLVRSLEHEKNPSPAPIRIKLQKKNDLMEISLVKQPGSITEHLLKVPKNLIRKRSYKSVPEYKLATQILDIPLQ